MNTGEVIKQVNKLMEYYEIKCFPFFTNTCKNALTKLRKLKKYESLDKQNKLLRINCNVGDTIYFPDKKYDYIFPVRISQIIVSDLGNGNRCVVYGGCFFDGNGDPHTEYEFDEHEIGKDVFLTRKEAEKKLKQF